jgi:ectoine hydroxylase-related dioxygenase (phytanoyl-CoA dioxygenase family)
MNRDIKKFHECGYVIVTDFLNESEYDELLEECHNLAHIGMETPDQYWVMNYPNNPCKLDCAMSLSGKLFRLGRNETLVKYARELIGPNIETYISKFFPMIPRKGFSVDWHQDNYYIKADPNKMISCDVFVQGATRENGCLRIIPNSQHELISHELDSHGVFEWISDKHWKEVIDIELDEPFAILFHPQLIHSCYRNTSDRFRYSVAWEYITTDNHPPTYNGHHSQDRLKIT